MRKHGMGACFLHAYNMRDYYVVPNSRGACANLKTRTCARSPEGKEYTGITLLILIKLPYLKICILCSKLSKGMGHNYYGEPA